MVKPSSFTPTDYLAAVLLIDTQCVTLSATLSSKDALASRWYVGFTLHGQAFAWVVVAHANHILAKSLSPPAESCLPDGWILSTMREHNMGVLRFQVYWYLHAIDLLHSGWLALRHTFQFDKLDKIDREEQRTTNSVTGFNSPRGTPFSNWIGCCLHPILLIATLETHLKGIETSAWRDWGQMMPLIMLILGVGHWLYLNLTQLYKYTKDSTSVADSKLIIPLDSSRLIAMGADPYEVGDVIYALLTAEGTMYNPPMARRTSRRSALVARPSRPHFGTGPISL